MCVRERVSVRVSVSVVSASASVSVSASVRVSVSASVTVSVSARVNVVRGTWDECVCPVFLVEGFAVLRLLSLQHRRGGFGTGTRQGGRDGRQTGPRAIICTKKTKQKKKQKKSRK